MRGSAASQPMNLDYAVRVETCRGCHHQWAPPHSVTPPSPWSRAEAEGAPPRPPRRAAAWATGAQSRGGAPACACWTRPAAPSAPPRAPVETMGWWGAKEGVGNLVEGETGTCCSGSSLPSARSHSPLRSSSSSGWSGRRLEQQHQQQRRNSTHLDLLKLVGLHALLYVAPLVLQVGL